MDKRERDKLHQRAWYKRQKTNGVIYAIRNKINNKLYIGATTNSIKKRWWQHISSANSGRGTKVFKTLWEDIRQYGKDSFEISVLEEVLGKEQLNEREVYYIQELNPDYNVRGNKTEVMDENKYKKYLDIVGTYY